MPLARAIMRAAATELHLDSSTTWELMLATSEAFANAVEHGRGCRPGGIRVRVESEGGQLSVEVSDCGGTGMRGLTKPRGEGGRGMQIIAAIMDHLEVVRDAGATRVRFRKRLALA